MKNGGTNQIFYSIRVLEMYDTLSGTVGHFVISDRELHGKIL